RIVGPNPPIQKRSFLLNPPASRLLFCPTTILSSSVVERSAVNRLVVGSNPTSGATLETIEPSRCAGDGRDALSRVLGCVSRLLFAASSAYKRLWRAEVLFNQLPPFPTVAPSLDVRRRIALERVPTGCNGTGAPLRYSIPGGNPSPEVNRPTSLCAR